MPDWCAILARLGISRGDVLSVHSGLNWFGGGLSSARSLLDALFEAIGPQGTLFMPSYPWIDGCAGMSMHGQTFDVRTSPARTGLLCELFRRSPGVERSEHLWVPVCGSGPLAKTLLGDQLGVVNAFSGNGFFNRLCGIESKLVGLGVSLNTSSAAHVVDADLRESLPGNLFVPIEGNVVTWAGETHQVGCEIFSPQASRRYDIRAVFSRTDGLRDRLSTFTVGDAICFSYPLQPYREEARLAGCIALKEGRLPPWLPELAPGGTVESAAH